MKVLVTGCNGFLGSVVCLAAREAKDRVLGTLRSPRFVLGGMETRILDIRDLNACLEIAKGFKPDAIIHCARYTVGIGQGEKDRETTFRVNTLGTRNLALCAERAGAVFAYFSTDWIFDGKKPLPQKYQEEEDPCPTNYYGFTKWAGEVEALRACRKSLIVRPANIYGVHALFIDPARKEEKDLMTRSSWTHRTAKQIQRGEKIGLPDTLYQSPTLANHLAEVTLRLVREGKTGVFHVAGRDGVSRYQFVRTLAENLGADPDLVFKTGLKDLEEAWEVPPGLSRTLPENACLNVEKVEKTLGIRMLNLPEGLARLKKYL